MASVDVVELYILVYAALSALSIFVPNRWRRNCLIHLDFWLWLAG
jgi:hypothetical protein